MRGPILTTSLNISALGQTGNTNSLLGKGVAAGQDGILAFLNLLAGQAETAQGGQDIAAKIAEILKQGQTDQPSLAALLQKLFPDASAEQIQQALASLQTPDAATETVKPSLTSDLSATLAIDAQENPDILAQLREKFAALMDEGEVTPDRLAHFRKDAIDFLKSQGIARADMDKYLVPLATDLGDRLTVPLAAQLGMPVPPQAVAAAQAPAQQSDETAASTEASADAADAESATSGGDETAAADAMTGLDFLQQQIAQSAPEETPEAGEAKQGIQLRAKADVSFTPPAPAADDGQAQRQENAPAQKTQPVHPSLVNSLAQGETGYGNGDSPSQMFQNGNSQMGFSGMMHAADKASAQSFVNYMTSGASATQTTQMIAMHIQRNANAGVNTFTMQLEPAELGRLEVRMRFGRDGGIRAHLIADKPETLSMLQNDSAQLHRILQQAGFDADDSALSFDLRHQGQHRDTEQSYNGAGQPAGYDAASSDIQQIKMPIVAEGYIRQNGVNIMV
ncbi:MAG: flagellar hook-length control protein FliK [Alphaproteobacteria bacterium]|nr:MAG: flagellar hook-length control protein FliK [Alphaproteobacteria bacterium]